MAIRYHGDIAIVLVINIARATFEPLSGDSQEIFARANPAMFEWFGQIRGVDRRESGES
jgi:hypothetical protein